MPEASDELLRVLRNILAPMVQADAGELYLVDVGADEITLHLRGRFSGCPGNTLVARRIIEPLISRAAPKTKLRLTSGYLVPDGAFRIEAP
jgi:Fe-S cluster biogenesis protein NfuA